LDRAIRGLCVATVDDAAIAAKRFTPVLLDTTDVVPTAWVWTDMAWSPDGQWLVAAPLGKPPAQIPARQGRSAWQGRLVGVPVAGGPAVVLAEGDESSAPGRPRAPAWSPDGREVGYYTYREGHLPHGATWTVDVAGGSARQLGIPVGSICPVAWSPDETLLVGGGFYGDGVVFIATPDERPPRSYVSPGADDDGTGFDCPAWQPRDQPIGVALPVADPRPRFSETDPRDVPEGM
jgi:Tol biopolymer transport system component